MKIDFCNTEKRNEKLIKKTLEYTRKKLNQPKKMELVINFLSSDEIKDANKNFRNIDQPTDVLSFPNIINLNRDILDCKANQNDINLDTKNLMLGDIYICLEVAKRQAEEYNHSLDRELAFLALHGFLHLLGYDHIEQNDETQMTKLQDDILLKLKLFRGNNDR